MNPVARIIEDREVARSLNDGNADICFLALAGPSLRTLVTREISDEGVVLFINKTSAKWRAIRRNPKAELLLWYQSVQRQYRIAGEIEELDPGVMAKHWRRRPFGSKLLDHAYEQFGHQSAKIDSRAELVAYIDRLRQTVTEADMARPAQAAGVILRPRSIECLDLNHRDRLHDRRLYLSDNGDWIEHHLIP